jgi:hypothetical protein
MAYFRRVWIVALPFVVAFLYPWVFEKLFAGPATGVKPPWTPDADTINHAGAAGIAVAATFTLLLISSICGTFLACKTAFTRLGTAAFCGYVVLGICIYATALSLTFHGSKPYIEDLGKDTFCSTVGQYFSPHFAPAPISDVSCSEKSSAGKQTAKKNSEDRLSPLVRVITSSGWTSVLVLVAITLCTVVISVLPAEPQVESILNEPENPAGGQHLDRASRDRLNDAAHDLADRIRNLKYLAFAAAAVLAIGVAFFKSWAEWPLAFLFAIDKKDKVHWPFVDAYQTLASALENYEGLFFVTIMVTVFGPLALILSRRGRHLARLDPELVDDPAKRTQWLANHGLTLTTWDQAQRFLVFISPLLAAPIAEVLKQLVTLAKP